MAIPGTNSCRGSADQVRMVSRDAAGGSAVGVGMAVGGTEGGDVVRVSASRIDLLGPLLHTSREAKAIACIIRQAEVVT